MNAKVTKTAAEQIRDASPVELSVHRASAPFPPPANAALIARACATGGLRGCLPLAGKRTYRRA